jgi:hypothetical protein
VKRFLLFLKEVLDALLVLALIASVAFLIYLLLSEKGSLPPSGTSLPGTVVVTSRPAETSTTTPPPSASPTPTPTPTRTFTIMPTSTATLQPATTAPSILTFTATPARNPGTSLPVDAEIEIGFERGTQIVQAIEAYIQERGFYPASLENLVPDYLPSIPVTGAGQPFYYRVFERTTVMSVEIYWVAFRVTAQDNLTCTYYRRLDHWDCNYASP